MNISIIGTGYVGLATGACFAECGVTITCIDTNPHRIQQLQPGKLPFYNHSVLQEMGFDYISVGRTPVGQVRQKNLQKTLKEKLVGALT